MIDIPVLARAGGGGRAAGRHRRRRRGPGGAGCRIGARPPDASPVTDAVKVVDGGLVQDSLDRDTLWSVEGFVLGP